MSVALQGPACYYARGYVVWSVRIQGHRSMMKWSCCWSQGVLYRAMCGSEQMAMLVNKGELTLMLMMLPGQLQG